MQKKMLFVLIIAGLISVTAYSSDKVSGWIRLILPTYSDLVNDNYSLKQGEMFFDQDSSTLSYYDNGVVKKIKSSHLNDNLPTIKKLDDDNLSVSSGEVYINGVKYENTSPITCSLTTVGEFGRENSDGALSTWWALYLIPNSAANGTFSCVLSQSYTGPVESTYSSAWVRAVVFPDMNNMDMITIFYDTTNFISKNGHTTFLGSGYSISYSVYETADTCVSLSTPGGFGPTKYLNALPGTVKASVKVISSKSSENVISRKSSYDDNYPGVIYSDSSCTQYAYGPAGTESKQLSLYSAQTPFTSYIYATASTSYTINYTVYEMNQEILESNN